MFLIYILYKKEATYLASTINLIAVLSSPSIFISSKSEPNKVAGALANVFREKGVVEVQAIGAGALNQAIKGVAIARGFVAPSGKNLVCTPAFIDINITTI